MINHNEIVSLRARRNYRLPFSFILGMLFVVSVLDIHRGVFDPTNSAILFSVCFISLLAVLTALPLVGVMKTQFTGYDMAVAFFILYPLFRGGGNDLWSTGLQITGLLYIVLRLTGNGCVNFRILYWCALASLFLLELYGTLQLCRILPATSPNYVVTGPFYNSAVYGSMLSLLLCIVIGPWINGKNLKKQGMFFPICLLVAAGMWLLVRSGARTSWIALLGGCCFLIYRRIQINPRPRNIKFKKRHKVILLIISVCLSTVMGYGLYLLKPNSAQGRVLIWKISMEMVKEKPLLGFGYQGFERNYMYYQHDYLKEKGKDQQKWLAANNRLAYNTPLRLWINYGVASMMLYLLVIYCAIFKHPGRNATSIACQGFLSVYFIESLFFYPDKVFPMQLFLVLALAFLANRAGPIMVYRGKLPRKILVRGVILGIGLYLGYAVTSYFTSYRQSYQFIANRNTLPEETLLSSFADHYRIMCHNPGFMASYCIYLNKTGNDFLLTQELANWEKTFPVNNLYILRGDIQRRQGKLSEAAQSYWYAHYMLPSHQRARSRLAYLYLEAGDTCRAQRLAREIVTEEVKIYGFATYEIHQELKQTFAIE